MTEPRRATMTDFLLFDKPDKSQFTKPPFKKPKNFGERKRNFSSKIERLFYFFALINIFSINDKMLLINRHNIFLM